MIQGKTVRLRALESDDLESYYRWINDPQTNYWRGLYHPMSRASVSSWIELEATKDETRLTFAIETTEGAFVGVIGLRGICPRSQRAEIWIYLGERKCWGMGIGTCAVGTLCRYAYEEMNLHRLWLECEPANKSAVRCYEKNGFRQESVLRDGYFRHGKFRDTIMMSRLRTDENPEK